MALHIDRGDKSAPSGPVSDRRLYLSADKARVVEEGDPAAAYLLAPAGRHIPPAEVERYGLRLEGGRIAWGPRPEPAPEPEPDPEPEPPKRNRKRAA